MTKEEQKKIIMEEVKSAVVDTELGFLQRIFGRLTLLDSSSPDCYLSNHIIKIFERVFDEESDDIHRERTAKYCAEMYEVRREELGL